MEEGDSMRLDRRLAGWGLFLILLGAIPLLVRQGVLSADQVSRAWSLWPLLLIAAGIGLLLRRTPLEFLGGLLTAATLGIIGGSLLATGFNGFGGCGGDRATQAFAPTSGSISGSGEFELTQNCGDLTVSTAAGGGWRVEGRASGQPPVVEAGPTSVRVTSGDRGFDFVSGQDDWTVVIPADPQVNVDATVNAGTGRFDLANAHLGRLDLTVNAGNLTLDLSKAASLSALDVTLNAVGDPRILLPNLSFSGSISANAAGNIRLCPPAGAGLRLTENDNITATNNYAARGLTKVGDAWQTPNYGTAAVRIDLDTSVNAGGYNLEPEGTCGG
jgi:hypothetical protein